MITTYLSIPVWDVVPYDILMHGPQSYHRAVGEIWNSRDKYNLASPQERISLTLVQKDQAERKAMRDWFDSLRGSHGSFWMQSHKWDYETYEVESAGAGSLRFINRDTRYGLFGVTRHVYLPLIDSAYKLSNVQEADGGASVVANVSPALSGQVPAGSEVRNLFLCRLTSDELEIKASRFGPGITEVDVTMMEVQGDTP